MTEWICMTYLFEESQEFVEVKTPNNRHKIQPHTRSHCQSAAEPPHGAPPWTPTPSCTCSQPCPGLPSIPPCSIPPHSYIFDILKKGIAVFLFLFFFSPSRVIKHRAPSVDFLMFDLCVCITILHQQKFRNLLLVTNERLTLDAECEVCTSPT